MLISAPLTLEKHLASFQETDSVYEHLYAAWKIAKADLPRILRNIAKIFPHYSLHDESHSEAIIRQIEAVLGEERISMIKPTETWLILMSAYTHDFGMLVQDENMHKTWRSDEFQEYLQNIKSDPAKKELREYADWFVGSKRDKLAQAEISKDWPLDVKWAAILLSADYFRSVHPQRGRAIIIGEENCFRFDLSFNRFVHERLLSLLGDVAFLHGEPFEKILQLSREANGVGQHDDIVYPRRVACLLRLGDLLDMDNGRFDEDAYLLYGEVPGSTISNREKHASIKHFLVKGNRIEIGADCPTEEGFEVTSRWIAMIQHELDNLALNWNNIVPDGFGTAPSLAYKDLRLNGRTLHGDVLRHFDFSNEAIFELLEGANIYKHQFSCFRELIQNAIDASKFRLWYNIQAGAYEKQNIFATDGYFVPFKMKKEILEDFQIEVEIQYKKVDNKESGFDITIRDRGIGIDERRLHFIEDVAHSWSNEPSWRKTINDMPKWLRPTGEFGLGLQSVFQLTNTLVCDTTPINTTPKHIVFRSKSNEGRISYQDIDSQFPTLPGSKFSFFVPTQCFESYHYSLGTFFDKQIHSMDPFLVDPEYNSVLTNLYYLYQCIIDDVGSSLFPIIIRLKIDDNIILEQEIPMRFCSAEDKKDEARCSLCDQLNIEIEKDDNLAICFDDALQSCTAYNVTNCILYQLSLAANYGYSHGVNLFFKGMNVDSSVLRQGNTRNISQVVHGMISLEGFSAKEYLTLNREKIKNEKINELNNLIDKDLEEIARKWIPSIIKRAGDNNANIDQRVLLSAISWSSFLNDEHCIIPDSVLQQSLAQIGVFRKDDSGNFVSSKDKLSDLIMKLRKGENVYIYIHDIPYLNSDDSKSENDKIKKLLGDMSADLDMLYDWNVLSHLINLDRLYVEELISEDARASSEMELVAKCAKRVNEHSYQLPKISARLQDLVNQNIFQKPRIALMATENWPKLAVRLIPWVLEREFHMHAQVRIGYAHYAGIISPFVQEDLDKLNGEQSPQNIPDSIIHRADFNRLVNYVKENNINENITAKEVREAYIEWIKYLLDWHNDGSAAQPDRNKNM